MASGDRDRRSSWDVVEKFDDVGVAHSHTAMAGRGSDQILAVRAVEVDVALPRIRIVGVESLKPENARENRIMVAAGRSDGTSGLAPLELHP